MAKWGAWFQDMGDAVIDAGHPVGLSKTVNADGVADNGGSNPLAGVSFVHAETIDDAVELAKGCPIIGHGSIEIAEAIDMEM